MRVREDRKPIDLHALWDGLLGASTRWQAISNNAIAVRLSPEFAPVRLHELKAKDVDSWVGESYGYAKHLAYGNGGVVGSAEEKDGAVLPDWYTDAAKAVAERRVVLAGCRIAELLRTTLGP